MGDLEPEPAIFCNQVLPQVEGLGHQPSQKTLTYSLSCLQSTPGLKPNQTLIKETRRDFMQKLRKVNAEYHSQTICGAQRALQSRGRKDWRNQKDQGHQDRTARPKESMTGIHRGSQRSGSLLGSDLDSLHISYSQGAWCSCRIPKSGSRSGQMILTKISIKLKLTKTTKNNDLIMKTSASLLICLLLQTKVSAIL